MDSVIFKIINILQNPILKQFDLYFYIRNSIHAQIGIFKYDLEEVK